jgi:hypothetical protein
VRWADDKSPDTERDISFYMFEDFVLRYGLKSMDITACMFGMFLKVNSLRVLKIKSFKAKKLLIEGAYER